MENLILSSIPLNELRTVISETVKEEFEKRHSHQTPQLETEYISRKETARLLGISLVTLNDWSKRSLIPSYCIASRIRYRKEEVLKSINQRQFCRKAVA
jgi:hypothetical protein